MSVYRDANGMWRYRKVVHLPEGARERISGTPDINSKMHAEIAERTHITRALDPSRPVAKKEAPKFGDWFNGRFWEEWVVSRKNKPSEVDAKKSIYKHHLGPAFAELSIDKIDVARIATFRAGLVRKELSDKSINNILAVLSKSLRYAADVEIIVRAPKVGMLKVERPEIECWEIEEWARLLAATKEEGDHWYVAACLCGEAGLRIGEVRALQWERDVDLVAKTITVNAQRRHGVEGTPKGRTRRSIPMSPTLEAALRAVPHLRRGYVVRRFDGAPLTDALTSHAVYRACKRARLPERGWHSLRHTFGTHAAMFGVNPWRLMAWMGHKKIDETMRHVHVADVHARPIPAEIVAAGGAVMDGDRRVLAMLSARGNVVPTAETADQATSA